MINVGSRSPEYPNKFLNEQKQTRNRLFTELVHVFYFARIQTGVHR